VSQKKKNSSSKSMFISPETDTESELVIKNPVGKLLACYDAKQVYVIK